MFLSHFFHIFTFNFTRSIKQLEHLFFCLSQIPLEQSDLSLQINALATATALTTLYCLLFIAAIYFGSSRAGAWPLSWCDAVLSLGSGHMTETPIIQSYTDTAHISPGPEAQHNWAGGTGTQSCCSSWMAPALTIDMMKVFHLKQNMNWERALVTTEELFASLPRVSWENSYL